MALLLPFDTPGNGAGRSPVQDAPNRNARRLGGYGASVPLSLLLPALAVILALGSLTVGLRTVERELGALRSSLRRSAATAVATDDLVRASDRLGERALAQIDDARLRLGRRPQSWSQDPNGRR